MPADTSDTRPPADTPHYHGHRMRLRDRFHGAGPDALSDYELLEMVLFAAQPRRDMKPLAKSLLKKFGSFAEVIHAPRNGREFEDFLVLQVGVGSAVSASLARQIENAVDWPDRVEGAGVAALERHLARPVVVDPVLVA
jgi:DNA repair protein RadC